MLQSNSIKYSETPILRPQNLRFPRILRFFRQVPVFPYTDNVNLTRFVSLMFMEFPAFYVFLERKKIKKMFLNQQYFSFCVF